MTGSTRHHDGLGTGGGGFIGSHLSERLLDRGDEVMVLDDLSTGSMDNLQHLVGEDGFDHRIGSALDESLVTELVDDADCTVHLAADPPAHARSAGRGARDSPGVDRPVPGPAGRPGTAVPAPRGGR